MITAKMPKSEGERLLQLASYSIMDSLPDEDYDNLTRLAAQICDTRISLVSLVDNNRQWFKSKLGLEVPEVKKDYAFCAHAIYAPNEVLIVPDARKDERFFDNPLVIGDPYIKFYAGVPLVNEEGYPLGTLCVIDDKPKKISPSQIKSLKGLAKQVMNLLELRRKETRLKDALADLQMKNQELEQFVYIASHDLKEPLRTMSIFISMIQSKHADQISDEINHYLEFVADASKRMNSLITGILDYSALGQTQEVKSVDCNKIIKAVQENLSRAINDAQAIIEISPLPNITANETEILQLFQNLLCNAIKFRRPGDIPLIHISARQKNHLWEFNFQDNGIGVEEKYKDKIFQVFQRLHSRDEYEGLGIGLANCKKIVETNGGNIWVNSNAKQGSTFSFTLPIKN